MPKNPQKGMLCDAFVEQPENRMPDPGLLFQQIINSAHDGIIVYGPDMRYQVWNPFMERLSGKTAAEVLGRHPLEIYPPLKETGVIDAIEKVLAGGPPVTIDYPYFNPSTGKSGWISDMCTPLRNEKGDVLGVIGIVREITERKRLENNLARINDCLSSLGADHQENINQLTALLGELLGAACALYNRIERGMLRSSGLWHAPPGFNPLDRPEGHICSDVIRQGGKDAFIVNNLPATPYAETDPNVRKYSLKTYIGRAVKCDGAPVGALCAVFQDDMKFDECDIQTIGIIATALGTEETRKQAAETVSESEKRFSQIAMQSREMIWEVDAAGLYTYVSDAAESILGYQPHEIMGKMHFYDLHPGEGREAFKAAAFDAFVRKENFQNIENQTRKKDGQIILRSTNGIPIVDENGELKGYRGSDCDITERKRAEEALRESEERFRTLFENAPLGYQSLDENGNFIELNETWCNTLGYTKKEVLGRNFSEFIHPDFHGAFMENFPKFKSMGYILGDEFEMIKKDGSEILVSFQGNVGHDTHGAFKQTHCVFQDITMRKRTEEALRESEERYRSLVTNINMGLYRSTTGSQGRFIEANPALADILGYDSIDELLNINISALYQNPDDRGRFIDELIREGFINARELPLLKKDGTPIWTSCSATVYYDEAGNALWIDGILEDVTKRKLAEDEAKKLQTQLLQAQKMEAIGHLAGGMAHDFNNMLGVIMSAAELARHDIDEDSPAQEELKEINDAVNRARELTMKLLTFSRKEKIDVRGVEARRIINDLQGMLSRTIPKNISLNAVVSDESIINCDRNQIQQALINVCNNAVDSMPGGGKLTIEAGEIALDEKACLECGQKMSGRYCLIQISDTGIGMTKDVLSRITDPFFTTKGIGKGTGLGLSVTQGIVRSHHGHLHIYSESDKGTCVKIYLPISENPVAQQTPEIEQKSFMGTETVLVVDDEKALLKLAGKILDRNGYKTLLADNGETAIELYGGRGSEIAVVVLDLMMPGMDGAEVNRKLKELNPDVKIVFASGFSEDGVAGNLMKDKGRRFVQKPFELSALCKSVRELIDGVSG